MFETLTERARRVIFFARYEASQCGGSEIETIHVLLGAMRELPNFLRSLMGGEDRLPELVTAVRALCRTLPGDSATASGLPLSTAALRVMAYAEEEASGAGQEQADATHVLAGVLREDGPESRILREFGVTLEAVRGRFTARMALGAPDRRALRELIEGIPESRFHAAARLLEILTSEWFAVAAITDRGPVTVVSPKID